MPTEVSTKTRFFTESVIREMTRRALSTGAVNLAQGFPDFPAPAAIKEAAKRAIDEEYNQYAITHGSPNFRRAIAEKARAYNGLECDPQAQYHGDMRSDRSDDRQPARGDQPGRRGHHLRAVLRELRTRHDPVRRDRALRRADRSRLFVRPARVGEGVQRPDQGDNHKYAA